MKVKISYFFFLKNNYDLKIGYHSRFNPECNTERGFIDSLSINSTGLFTIISDNFSLNLIKLTLLCMPSVLHFSKVRYLCIERPCLLLQKRVLWSLKDICMIVNLNLDEFALSHPMGSRWPYFILPIHIWYLLPCSI